MRREIIISLCMVLALPAAGQVEPDCEPVMIQKLDSVVNYARVGQTDSYTPADVFIYEFDGIDKYPVVERFSRPSGIRVNRQVYSFDDNGRKNGYVLQVWDGTDYVNSSGTDYYYTPEGFLEKEVFSTYQGGSWAPYQQHWYNYNEEMTVLTYLRQMMYSPDIWTDYSYKNYIYDDQSRLIERNEQRISDGVIFWVELFIYDEDYTDRVSTRIRQTLKYFPDTRSFGIVNLSRQMYAYDGFGEISGYISETWANNEWVVSGKSIYYRSFLSDRIIPVCFNGRTMMVPVRAALRLFSRGALPGSCECLFPEGYPEGAKGNNGKSADGGLIVYPNPASNEITVVLPEGQAVPGDISIYSHGGSLVKRTIAGSRSETVNISGLKSGSYYLIVTADGISLRTSFVKNH